MLWQRRMAKKRKGGQAAAQAPAAEKGQAPRSVLEAAWQAYSAGDMVQARAACAQLLSGTPGQAEAAFAAKLAPELFGRKDAPSDVAAVAGELRARTEPPKQAYLFAAVAAAVFVVLLLVAHRG